MKNDEKKSSLVITNTSAEEFLKSVLSAPGTEWDSLTGAVAFCSFRAIGERIVRHNYLELRKIDIVYLNIVRFREYNERCGFARGDQLLKSWEKAIEQSFPNRLVCRTQGDQFAVIAYDEEAECGLDSLEESLHALSLEMPRRFQAGIYTIDDSTSEIAVAIDRAKLAASYVEKEQGMCYRRFDRQLNDILRRKRYVANNVQNAVDRGWIRVYYQPILHTLSREVCCLEALCRWEDPYYGLLPPDMFVSTLEERRLIHIIDCCMIRKVCEDIADRIAAGKTPIPVSFNLSRLDFELCDIRSVILDAVEQTGIPRNLIHIEITESVMTKSPEFIMQYIRKFHRDGFQVWMDDFGSGYSSLNILKDSDFDLIKIDMQFLRNFSNRSRKIVAAVVGMAKSIGIRTLAEGVETEEQLRFLRNIGCERAQGYLIGKPMPLPELLKHLPQEGYPIETSEQNAYFEAMGGVDVLGTNPMARGFLEGSETEEPDKTQSMPLAIFEYDGKRGRFLFLNHSFRDVLQTVGIYSLRNAVLAINNADTEAAKSLREGMNEAAASEESVSVDAVISGNYCVFQARVIARMKDTAALLVTMQNLSLNFEFSRIVKLNDIMPLLFIPFDRVYLLFPEEDRCTRIYSGDGYVGTQGDSEVISREKARIETLIRPDELMKFREYTRLSDLYERLQDTRDCRMEDTFHVRKADGEYCVKLFALAATRLDTEHRILFSIRSLEKCGLS